MSISISADTVLMALRAVRYGHGPGRNGLEDLDCVRRRLRAEGLPDTEQMRQWMAGCLIAAIVEEALDRPAVEGPSLGQLADDFAGSDKTREAWSALYFRYLATPAHPVTLLAHHAGVSSRTLERRVSEGVTLLARQLARREAEAREREYATADVANTVFITPHRSPGGDTLARLRNGLRNGTTVRLTPAENGRLAQRDPEDIGAYRLSRIAAWSAHRYQIDSRFVRLTLLTDLGPGAGRGRWSEEPQSFDDIRDVVAARPDDRAFVLLGEPGSGKSTLLRRLELVLCATAEAAANRPTDEGLSRSPESPDPGPGRTRESGAGSPAAATPRPDDARANHSLPADPITFLVPLNEYRGSAPWVDPPPPLVWLRERWARECPHLPELDSVFKSGRAVLLLDALNEMPTMTPAEYLMRVLAWKGFVQELARTYPANLAIFSCRTLDYSAPLSSVELPVPQIRVEPMSNPQVESFLELYSPRHGTAIWQVMRHSSDLALVRNPFFARLLVEQVESDEQIPVGRSEIMSGFVQQSLRRELKRDTRSLVATSVLSRRDRRSVVQSTRSADRHRLPSEGPLIPGIERLATGMQRAGYTSAGRQVVVPVARAEEMVSAPEAADVLAAAADIGLTEEDANGEHVMFRHQLFQEYFAARVQARGVEAELVATPWLAAEMDPGLADELARLPAAEPMPPAPTTGWEETVILAAGMAPDPEAFVLRVADANLSLAGRCAVEPEVRVRLSASVLGHLSRRLAARAEDRQADLRARISAARYLGVLGDTRVVRHDGRQGGYLLGPLVPIDGGRYPLGSGTEPGSPHSPEHVVEVAPFAMGKYPVTNAEWSAFIAAGGYEEERWWSTEGARLWRKGIGTARASRQDYVQIRGRLLANPRHLDEMYAAGRVPDKVFGQWKRRLRMSDREFDEHLEAVWPEERKTLPEHWFNPDYNLPNQPVVGICWYEALAFCQWLSAQTAETYRLPTEAEWEAAAGGCDGRRYAFGDEWVTLACNSAESRVRAPSPVGVFVEGATPEGIADLTGNVFELTSSLFGVDIESPLKGYPYRQDDGREDLTADGDWYRVCRGGTWASPKDKLDVWLRVPVLPDHRGTNIGLRVAMQVVAR